MADSAVSWHERAKSVRFPTQSFIGGRYVDSASGETFESINPATGKVPQRLRPGMLWISIVP